MKLQKATLCALYAVLELAAEPGRTLSAAEIARTYGVSLNHLAKVLRDRMQMKLNNKSRERTLEQIAHLQRLTPAPNLPTLAVRLVVVDQW